MRKTFLTPQKFFSHVKIFSPKIKFKKKEIYSIFIIVYKNSIKIYQPIFTVTEKTAQWRIYLKSFEDLNYLKFIELIY